MAGKHAIAFRAVKIVGIDGGERLVDGVGGQQNGLRGAPRLGAARRAR